MLSAERLRALLNYEPETGAFHWINGRPGVARGSEAGCVCKNGYIYISVDGVKHLAHRLAWLYMTGQWPKGEIDHRNGERTDNRFSNIRDVSIRVNAENRWNPQGQTRSGRRGVSWHDHSRKWRVRINVRGVEHRIGMFDTVEEASAAYVQAKRQMHEGCTI